MSALHIGALVALSFGAVSSEERTFVRTDNANAVPTGSETTQKTLENCEATCVDSCLQYAWNKKSHHCYTSSSAEWSPISSDHIESGCLADQVDGCPGGPAPSPAPTPTPTPPPPPAPTPDPPPGIEHKQLVAPTPIGSASQAAAMNGVYYFLPPTGSSAFITFDASTSTWGTLDIDADSGVISMLKGASLAAVPAAVPGLDDFLVVSGGGTKHVKALNMRTQTWQDMADMHNSQDNSCSVGCLGYWMSMTGDMKGQQEDALSSSKPANRQEYRYNLTSGEHFEVNGEKERGGAGCGCDESANGGSGRAFWAGGYSNSAITNQIEMWSVNPNKRGGQPIFKMSTAKRDVGAAVCGGRFIVAGGANGKSTYSSVDVFNSSSMTDGDLVTYEMGVALKNPQVSCLAGKVALISAGGTTQIFALDTDALPAAGAQLAALPLPLGGSAAAASTFDPQTGTVMFFDGQHGDLFSMASVSTLV